MNRKSVGLVLTAVLLATILIVPSGFFAFSDESEAANSDGYYYNKLSTYPKKAYDIMIPELEAGKSEFSIGKLSDYGTGTDNEISENIITGYFAILKDRPDLFWLGNNIGINGTTDNITVTITGGIASNKISSMTSSINSSLSSFSAGTGSTYDKLLTIHDYIVKNTSYKTQFVLV